jgi:hypothetical protein
MSVPPQSMDLMNGYMLIKELCPATLGAFYSAKVVGTCTKRVVLLIQATSLHPEFVKRIKSEVTSLEQILGDYVGEPGMVPPLTFAAMEMSEYQGTRDTPDQKSSGFIAVYSDETYRELTASSPGAVSVEEALVGLTKVADMLDFLRVKKVSHGGVCAENIIPRAGGMALVHPFLGLRTIHVDQHRADGYFWPVPNGDLLDRQELAVTFVNMITDHPPRNLADMQSCLWEKSGVLNPELSESQVHTLSRALSDEPIEDLSCVAFVAELRQRVGAGGLGFGPNEPPLMRAARALWLVALALTAIALLLFAAGRFVLS